MLKIRYDELVNAMDMVGFTDEVSGRTRFDGIHHRS